MDDGASVSGTIESSDPFLLEEGVPVVAAAAIPVPLARALEAVFGRPPRLLRPGAEAGIPEDAVVFALDDLPGRRFVSERSKRRTHEPLVVVADAPGRAAAGRIVWLRSREVTPISVAVAVRGARIVAALERDRARLSEQVDWQRDVLDDLRRYDPITELLSREAFLDEVQRAIDLAGAFRAPSAGIGIVRFRLRGFEHLRENWPESDVEAYCAAIARRIEGTVREQDVAGRTREEEFSVLVRGEGVEEGVSRMVRACTGFPREPVILSGGRRGEVAGTLGWAIHAEVGSPDLAEDFLRAAMPRWPVRNLAA
ncbi:MAG: GGDEF domain-containing protein [Deltaproteobacteria bacterium]|nr:MAG: GGDEF domain-containing protein [Deltaproteobacteria bacterium]